MRGGDDVGAGLVDRRVDDERRPVDRGVASTTSPWWLTRSRSLARIWRKLLPNGLTQKWSGARVAHRDVPGDALGEAETAEDAEGAGELGLAVGPLVGDVVERRRPSTAAPRVAATIFAAVSSATAGDSVMAMAVSVLPPRSTATNETELSSAAPENHGSVVAADNVGVDPS